MSCSQNALESLEKGSNFVLEKSGKPQSDFCANPDVCASILLHGIH